MKLYYKSSMVLLFAAILSISNALAQEGQLIPFQGTLYQSGAAVNGTVNITFTIDDPAWTELHENVSVTQGVYAVVLGETTAFPEDLFTTGVAPQLVVTIGGTEVADVPLYAPFINKGIVEKNMPDVISRTFDEDAGEHNGMSVVVDGTGAGQTAAIEGVAQSTTYNTGVEGFAISESGNTEPQSGVYGTSLGEGTGNHRGVMGYATGGGKYNHGVKGYASGAGNGEEGFGYGEGSINFGVEGQAGGNAWSNTGIEGSTFGAEGRVNYGVHGISSAGTFDTSDTLQNYGVAGRAYGPGKNYGIYGGAADGINNWAGYFDGDVNINGDLTVNGQNVSSGGGDVEIIHDGVFDSLQINNPNGEVRAELSYSDYNDAGLFSLYGANDSLKAIIGATGGGYGSGLWLYDSLQNTGAQLRVTNKGQGNLYMYNEQQKNTAWFGNASNKGLMQIVDYDEAGVDSEGAILAGFWSGEPSLYLETTNNNEKVYIAAQEKSGFMRLTGESSSNIEMGAKFWEPTNGGDLAYLKLQGVTQVDDGEGGMYLPDMIFMDAVHDSGAGVDRGHIGVFDTDGNAVHINSGGIEIGQDSYQNGIVMNYDNSGGAVLEIYSGGGSTINMNGTSGHINTVSLAQTSDARFKKNVKSIDGALAKTQKLNGYIYNWNKLAEKQKGIKNKEEQVGVLAQELEEVFPQLVKTDEEGYKSVNYAALTAVLIEAVKELSAEIGNLKEENTELKAELTKVDRLEMKIDLIEKVLAKQTMEASKATVSR